MLHKGISIIVAGILAVGALTASANPTPTPTPTPSPSAPLNSTAEGAKAALVRIELVARSEIAHINASTGVAVISRGKSTVPLGYATGVLVSADGIVATTWENLAVDEDAVAVYSANELFSNVIGVPVVGNNNNPLRRGSTPDQQWAPHLKHCYDLVDHCVLFQVPQYRIRTYTSEPGSVWAELINKPTNPHDVALLQITGGGGAPTATLASPNLAPSGDSALLGFVKQPGPTAGPAVVPVTVNAAAGRIASLQDLTRLLEAGLSGGPVIDGTTGQVLGLAGPRTASGRAMLTPAAAIQAAMADAGVEASPSKFDAVFRRGIDHLASGNQGGSAESAFEESLTYYDSALAASHLEQARASGSQKAGDQPAASDSANASAGLPPAVLLSVLGGVLLAGILTVVALRRRRAASATGSTDPARPRHVSATDITAPGNPIKPPREGPDLPDPGLTRSGQIDADMTRAAGPFALRATPGPTDADGQAQIFCSHCGQPVQPGARFCISCGQPVG
jgi:hypothetical protein